MNVLAQRIPYRLIRVPALCLATLAIAPLAVAQLAVSSNDNKVINVDGVNIIVENPGPITSPLWISASRHPKL